jgi:hypothetical protein
VLPGDTIYVYVAAGPISLTFSIPSFSSLTAVTGSSGAGSCQLLYYTYLGTEGWTPGTTTVTLTSSAAAEMVADICAVSGLLDPGLALSGQINASSATITVAGVTTRYSNDMQLWFGWNRISTGTSPVITQPAGWSVAVAQSSCSTSASANPALLMATRAGGVYGATGNQNGTSATAESNGGLMLSFASPPAVQLSQAINTASLW